MATKNIYMGKALEDLAKKTQGSSRRTSGFSSALEEIVERWGILQELTGLPSMSETETGILSEVICGSVINKRKVRGLHLDVLDSVIGTQEQRQELSNKVAKMSVGDRLVLITRMGQ